MGIWILICIAVLTIVGIFGSVIFFERKNIKEFIINSYDIFIDDWNTYKSMRLGFFIVIISIVSILLFSIALFGALLNFIDPIGFAWIWLILGWLLGTIFWISIIANVSGFVFESYVEPLYKEEQEKIQNREIGKYE